MRAVVEIEMKALKAAVVSLNNLEFLPERLNIVGKTKEAVRDAFVEAIDGLSVTQQKKLPKDVKDMYNYIIVDELEESTGVVVPVPVPAAPAPTPSSVPAETAKKTKTKTKTDAASTGKAVEELKQECEVKNLGWDKTTVECLFCREKFPLDYRECMSAVKERKRQEAKEKREAATERKQYSRTRALADALRAGAGSAMALAKRSNEKYIEKGGKDSIKEALWINRFALATMAHLGVIVKNDENVLFLNPAVVEALSKKTAE